MPSFTTIAISIIAYLLGSIPTALIVGRRFKGIDIRTIGNGNMGASNVFHTLGEKPGILVAVIDFLKGTLPVLVATLLGFSMEWRMIVGVCAILGHDFPIFAGFRGGQGTATTLGTMLILFPMQTLFGLILYGTLFLITRNSRRSCGFGGGLIALLLGISQQWLFFVYAIVTFVSIPLKLYIDTPRRRAIKSLQVTETLKS
jgi:acyl phosphate:glycerol-3-phosphate acyltransferase